MTTETILKEVSIKVPSIKYTEDGKRIIKSKGRPALTSRERQAKYIANPENKIKAAISRRKWMANRKRVYNEYLSREKENKSTHPDAIGVSVDN